MSSFGLHFGQFWHHFSSKMWSWGALVLPGGSRRGGPPSRGAKGTKKAQKGWPKVIKKRLKMQSIGYIFLHFFFSSSVVFRFSPSPLLRYSFYSVLFRSLPVQVYIYIENADARPPHLAVFCAWVAQMLCLVFADLAGWVSCL